MTDSLNYRILLVGLRELKIVRRTSEFGQFLERATTDQSGSLQIFNIDYPNFNKLSVLLF